MGRHHLENLNCPFGGGNDDSGVASGGVGNSRSGGGANEVLGNIYRNDASASCVGNSPAGCKSARTNLQTFDSFPSLYPPTRYNSSGGMTSSVGLAFTSTQWKELEKQAMIFKYLKASVPLPDDLLYPLTLNVPAPASDPTINSSGGDIYNARFSKNRDPEPGRCKRTDGKKWRCSKDVVPLQKYCERHLHKGRSRSRKPVEVRDDSDRKKTRLEQIPNPALQSQSTSSLQLSAPSEPLLLFNPKSSDRDVGLMMEFESSGSHWKHLMKKANMDCLANDFSSCSSNPMIFHQECVGTSYPFSYSNFQDDTRVFDAWSFDNNEKNKNGDAKSCLATLHQENLSPSLNLSIAVASGNVLDGETSTVRVDSDLKDSDDAYSTDTRWLPLCRGGPLGEALQPLLVGVECSNPASPYDSIHTTATTVSSPSGVLHGTLFSHSENSVCNSPPRVAPSLESAFQWFS